MVNVTNVFRLLKHEIELVSSCRAYRYVSFSSSEEKFSDICCLAKVWNRAPLRTQNRYPPDQRAFSLTRDATETTSKYQNGLCFKEENNVVLTEFKNVDLWTKTRAYVSWLKTKLFVLGAEPCLTMSSDDLIQGGRKVFRIILDAVVRKNIDSLTPLVLRSAVLDVHRKRALELKEKQRNALSVGHRCRPRWNGWVCSQLGWIR
ncbi:hypothetical protein GCK32_015320 [Trichostrongylus colubriformis]|uniref:Uncharacterized protein n=1 Tax=Trichostrongylus colubriformis TaxID=6319 RepID=A0AAN8ITX5_TRICO